jgi:hypothetical protein
VLHFAAEELRLRKVKKSALVAAGCPDHILKQSRLLGTKSKPKSSKKCKSTEKRIVESTVSTPSLSRDSPESF